MSEQHQHHHHSHQKEDYASRFKRRGLQSIVIRRMVDKWLKIALFIIAIFMVLLLMASYLIG